MIEPPYVLIAEDNPGLAKVLSFKFKSCGFTPIVCNDGMAAWEAFQNQTFVAVVSDQEMPRMTGVELCRNIRDRDSEIPFFLVTGRQMELSSTGIAEELNIGMIFSKPFSPQTVIAAVNEAMETPVVVS
ncbi:Sensory transduction protein regX3 [Rubripirellula obstinata]|uniref:Sensory transduction protein regX3 n=1 Tax=Rubripirellula obstinata TaxID=406547 RepID=A0A5B1CC16_9BACT|nr:response regulator [Rubripirellula obstinata]KAA1258718.1 Sensory transduction protein regX3 [Rubripirellula obstinata]